MMAVQLAIAVAFIVATIIATIHRDVIATTFSSWTLSPRVGSGELWRLLFLSSSKQHASPTSTPLSSFLPRRVPRTSWPELATAEALLADLPRLLRDRDGASLRQRCEALPLAQLFSGGGGGFFFFVFFFFFFRRTSEKVEYGERRSHEEEMRRATMWLGWLHAQSGNTMAQVGKQDEI